MLKRKITLVLVAIILTGLLVYLGYFLGLGKTCQPEEPEVLVPEELGAGDIGEVGETFLVSPTMPPAIFSTAGVINEIESDRLIVRGEGTNFADGVPRTLTVIFTDQTTTFNKNQNLRWTDKAGLKQLQPGMKILIGSTENIRGKTEFKAKTVNIL